MKLKSLFAPLTGAAVLALLVGCGPAEQSGGQSGGQSGQGVIGAERTAEAGARMATAEDNILLAPWSGPYGGLPPFDKMNIADLTLAIEAGIAEHLANLDKIANNPEAPTFANTIEAMERADGILEQVFPFHGLWRSNLSTPEVRAVMTALAPKLSEYNSKIIQNKALFKRVVAVYKSEEAKRLRPDQQRLLLTEYESFTRGGATLAGAEKERFAEISAELSALYNKFSNNVLAEEEKYVVYLTDAQLGGLPENVVKAAAAAAEERGRPGEYAITNTRSSMTPFLAYSDERALREKVWSNYYSRGGNGDENDTYGLIAQILKLRHERVNLLGYKDYASWRLENRMAGKPESAVNLMMAVWPHALSRVREEVADMQAIVDAEGGGFKIAPWDYRYYSEKVRLAKYDLDSDEVKQYLQLDKLQEAMFYVSGELFNFKFTPVPEGSVPVFHPDVKVWEVTDKTSGDHVGLWYLDPFARQGKRSGAWAVSYRSYRLEGGRQTTLSSNNSNFVKGAPGEPVLISFDDAETLFHEFGHALHALSSNVAYRSLNSGVRDYTEFQSQLLERWLLTEPVINKYLVHYKTGEPIPAKLVAKIKKAGTFNQGFATTEYLASALMDMAFHTTDPENIDPAAFERETLAELGMPSEIVMRHRTPHFSHAFGGEGYSAGYYGYLWAEVLTSDAAEAFRESEGGFYDKGMAKKLVEHLFAPRNAVDPAQAYRAFRGRDAEIDALMRDRGFKQ